VECSDVERYGELLNPRRVRRIYLNELGDRSSVGINTLKLIVSPEEKAIRQGNALIQQIRQEATNTRQQQDLLELIETILVYKLPRISRRELEKMFSLNDLRETRVYQEALEEGIEQGIEQGMERAKLDSIPRLLALGLSVEQIAQALELKVEQVRMIAHE
jgi:predicted transposase/invertase (TIGR01784 family)